MDNCKSVQISEKKSCGRSPAGGGANVWGTPQPTKEEAAAKKAAMKRKHQQHADEFIRDSQRSNPIIFEDFMDKLDDTKKNYSQWHNFFALYFCWHLFFYGSPK